MKETYRKQVGLLLAVLPEVAKEECFALHGGTAINLFVRDMPRLSVDIDLTYVSIEPRDVSLLRISGALTRIASRIQKVLQQVRLQPRLDVGKLLIAANGVVVKLEVSLMNRGLLNDPLVMPLCDRAQTAFEAFCAVPVVPMGQLYGGKIIATLDRQHPRDLFDMAGLSLSDELGEDVKRGFLLCLLGSERPLHEILLPNVRDQRLVLEHQFSGMTDQPFSYGDFEATRARLVTVVMNSLLRRDREFLIGFNKGTPDWTLYDFSEFPSVNWKLKNLRSLQEKNEEKHRRQCEMLELVLADHAQN